MIVVQNIFNRIPGSGVLSEPGISPTKNGTTSWAGSALFNEYGGFSALLACIRQKWAKGWILGLVPPSTVETMGRCPDGVAQVDTQLSFLNQLVTGITFGIFTPMEIVVTCAEGEGNSLPVATNPDEAQRLLKSGVSFLIPW